MSEPTFTVHFFGPKHGGTWAMTITLDAARSLVSAYLRVQPSALSWDICPNGDMWAFLNGEKIATIEHD